MHFRMIYILHDTHVQIRNKMSLNCPYYTLERMTVFNFNAQ